MNKTNLIYQINDLPLFQNRMYDSSDEAINCPRGNIRLVQNLLSGLIYNESFHPEKMVYDGNYQNEQAVSPLFRQHLETVATVVCRTMGTVNLVEVGCGKGSFLEILIAKGLDISGFDPTYEGQNPRVRRQYFAPGLIQKANGLILRHVLEHIQNPLRFLTELKEANGGQGRIYIEVPDFDWICKHKTWFDVFYEHVNYFRLTDLRGMFSEVIESGSTFGGQYIYITAELNSLKQPVIKQDNIIHEELDLAENISGSTADKKHSSAIWGGASKGVIFALMKERTGLPISTVIDINPAKQGKFLPGTGIEVKSPESGLADLEIGSIIYVMNSNYLQEIKEMSNNNYVYHSVD